MIAANRLAVEHVRIERSDFGEAAPSLEPLLARLRDVVRKVNGKRIVLDTSEALFAANSTLTGGAPSCATCSAG